jgi:excisionase family DNA binding protein
MSYTAAVRSADDQQFPDRTVNARSSGLDTLPSFEPVLNTEEAAALLQVHPKTLQRLARQGRVPAFRIGDLWRFRASALDAWLQSGICSKSPLVP